MRLNYANVMYQLLKIRIYYLTKTHFKQYFDTHYYNKSAFYVFIFCYLRIFMLYNIFQYTFHSLKKEVNSAISYIHVLFCIYLTGIYLTKNLYQVYL